MCWNVIGRAPGHDLFGSPERGGLGGAWGYGAAVCIGHKNVSGDACGKGFADFEVCRESAGAPVGSVVILNLLKFPCWVVQEDRSVLGRYRSVNQRDTCG